MDILEKIFSILHSIISLLRVFKTVFEIFWNVTEKLIGIVVFDKMSNQKWLSPYSYH